MERVAVYFVEKQNNEKYTRTSLKKIDEWCNANDYDYTLYIDKVEHRNMIDGRTDLEQMKKDVIDGYYSKIIIKDLSNVSRDMRFNLELITFAEENDCKIISMDKINPHKYAKFVVNLLKKMEEEK